MAAIVLRRFGGQQPRLDARLLSPEQATIAVNAKLWNGKLRAFKRPRSEFTTVKAGPILSAYKYRGGGKEGWFHFATDVDVMPTPIANDDYGRVYYTGSGRPKVTDSSRAVLVSTTTTALANSGATTIAVASARGFQIGDVVRVDYDGASTQDVTLTGVSGLNLSFSGHPLSANLSSGRPVVNRAQRYPLDALDLGVPAPAAKLTTAAITGIATGTISSVADEVIASYSVTENSTVGTIQSAGSALSKDLSVPAAGFSIELIGNLNIFMAITRSEPRDVTMEVIRSPAGTPVNIGSQTTHVSPSPGARPTAAIGLRYDVPVSVIDNPTAATYTYRFTAAPIAGIAGDGNDAFNVDIEWNLRAVHSNRVRLYIGSGHGLTAGARIELSIQSTSDNRADQDLDGQVFEVLAAGSDYVVIPAIRGGRYESGGTWRQTYDAADVNSRSYVYTYVATIQGQDFESGPSPPSDVLDVAEAQTVRVTGFVNPTTPTLLWDTNFQAIRIYRFQVGDNSVGSYLFVSEQALNVTQFDDTVPGSGLGEALPTEGWELPPENLKGLIELPEGGAAAFTDKELCLAVPYFPHAWPAAYRRTTHDRIVAIGAFGSSIGVATEGTPYVFSGTDPLTMTSERMEVIEPCLSKRGSVDLGYGFVYPSPNGLVMLATGRAEVITDESHKDLFTADEWMALNPASFVATRYQDRYLCFYDNGTERGGFILDPRSTLGALVFLDFWASAAWSDTKTGKTYIVQDGVVKEFDAGELEETFTWRSKEFTFVSPVSMAVSRVEARKYPVEFRLLGDGQLVHIATITGPDDFRLPEPSYSMLQVELRSQHQVDAVFLAESAEELARVQGGL